MTTDQRITEQCPKCGAAGFDTSHKALLWKCGSAVHTGFQSDRCRITELSQQLSVAVAALDEIRTACPQYGNGLPGINEHAAAAYRKCERIAAEALKQIGATDGK